MASDGYGKADREKNGRKELMAFWAKSGYSPSGRLRDLDIEEWLTFLAGQKLIPEKERGYITFYENRVDPASKAPTHRLVYQTPKAKVAPAPRADNNEPDW
jgi:hypothetical protein